MCFCECVSECVPMNVFLRMCFQFAFNVQNTGPEKCGVKQLTFKVVIGTVFIVTANFSFAYTMVLSVLFLWTDLIFKISCKI